MFKLFSVFVFVVLVYSVHNSYAKHASVELYKQGFSSVEIGK